VGGYNIPDMIKNMYTSFGGYAKFSIVRKENEDFIKPKYNEHIIEHKLSDYEKLIFTQSRLVLQELNKTAKNLKDNHDVNGLRKFNAYLLGMIAYVRQCVVNPIIPISKIFIDIADFNERSHLSEIVSKRFKDMGINEYFEKDESLISSRYSEIFKVLEKHPTERILIFSCYRSCIELLIQLMKERYNRDVFTIDSTQNSSKKRGEVLALTYQIGAEGLNLQSGSVVLLVDLDWNSSKIKQAIGRIYRPGQLALSVNIYFFISNTGMEQEMIKKNRIKDEMLKELEFGSTTKKFPKLKVEDMIKIINMDLKQDLIMMRNVRT
jgi:SNF2 family DNA or RNA helicase